MKDSSPGDLQLPFSQDPQFFPHIFSLLIGREKEGIVEKIFDLKKEAILSFLCDLSTVQDGFRMRSQRRAQLLASFLVDEKGELKKEELSEFLRALEAKKYIIYPGGTNDGLISEHILFILKKLQNDPSFFKRIKKIQRPLCHKAAETLIRETLGEHTATITDADIRKAVLSCCFSILRQNVGSCFATAPAILIHEEQIEGMIEDLYELLTKGKLKRTFGGTEYSVPLSPSWGVGDLKKGILSTDPQAKVWMSPGLMTAFSAAGLFPETSTDQEKIGLMSSLIEPILEKGKEKNIEEIIRIVLLKHFQISEDELAAAQRIQEAIVFIGRGIGPMMPETAGRKREQALLLLQKEKEAKAAFKRITDHPLMKAWEFTIASFSEIKMEFSKWNLYSSLGLHPEEKGGIGEILYKNIESKLEECNQKMQQFHQEYEAAFEQLRGTESLLRQAGSEAEVRRLQAEYQSRLYHMQASLDVRDRWHNFATRYATFFGFLIEQYTEKFQEYFQEIFDAEMIDLKGSQYEDSPAGFRLVYKHGRSDASLWTLIYTAEQYIDSLVDFFLSVESPISSSCDWDEGSKDISVLTTAVVSHLRTKEFIETAFLRMAKVHGMRLPKEGLTSWETWEKKPWAYTSGGTMSTLLKTYYKRENEITEESRWIESEADLLVFILDVLKNLPPRVSESFLQLRDKRLLMHSPTHAFILQPGWDLFKEGWQDNGFTYTWVRDQIYLPRLQFFEKILLSSSEQLFLVLQFASSLPPLFSHRLKNSFTSFGEVRPVWAFRDLLLKMMQELGTRILTAQKLADRLDSFLYEMLPLIPGQEWKANVRLLLSDYSDKKSEKFLDTLPDYPCELMTAKAVKDAAKGCFLYAQGSVLCSIDLHRVIAKRAAEVGLGPPIPLLFSDSNWPNCAFAFVVNPGSKQFELWRMDIAGTQGMPMSDWKKWMDGNSRLKWSIYNQPHEYRYSF